MMPPFLRRAARSTMTTPACSGTGPGLFSNDDPRAARAVRAAAARPCAPVSAPPSARAPGRSLACAPASTARRALSKLRRLGTALLAACLPLAAAALEEVPYVQTPQPVVDAILGLAGVGPGDRLIDLGAGDGRIVITAAQRFGTRGTGIEIDPALVRLAGERAAAAGVADRARFVVQDLFETDLSGATVVTLYLLPDVNLALRPRLLETLAPGTRIVSHDWDMGDWLPDRSLTMPVPDKPVGSRRESTLHLWVVPARVDGDWLLQVGDAAPLRMTLEQRYQRFTIEVPDARPLLRPVGPAAGASAAPHPGAGPAARGHGSLAGAAIGFELPADGRDLRFNGTAEGDRMQGLVMDGGARRPWSARRVRDAAARPARPR